MRNIMMVIVIALISQSCATMFSGTRYTANVSATQPESLIYVDGKLKGMNSVTYRQKRKDEPVIEVRVVEGDTTEFTVYRTIKWGSQVANLLNWIYFIPVGTIVDAASGGIYQPEHKHVPEVTKVNNKTFDIVIDNAIR